MRKENCGRGLDDTNTYDLKRKRGKLMRKINGQYKNGTGISVFFFIHNKIQLFQIILRVVMCACAITHFHSYKHATYTYIHNSYITHTHRMNMNKER